MVSKIPCFFQMISNVIRFRHHNSILCHIGNRVNNIKLLVTQLTELQIRNRPQSRFAFDLPRNNKHRDAVQPAAHNARNCIRTAGAAGHTDTCNFPRCPGVCLRRNRASLFIMIENIVQALFVSQCIVQLHCTTARYHKIMRNAVFYQKVCHILCCFHSLLLLLLVV